MFAHNAVKTSNVALLQEQVCQMSSLLVLQIRLVYRLRIHRFIVPRFWRSLLLPSSVGFSWGHKLTNTKIAGLHGTLVLTTYRPPLICNLFHTGVISLQSIVKLNIQVQPTSVLNCLNSCW
jgi:hypothetical protein